MIPNYVTRSGQFFWILSKSLFNNVQGEKMTRNIFELFCDKDMMNLAFFLFPDREGQFSGCVRYGW